MQISVAPTYNTRILYRKIEKDKIIVLTKKFFFTFQFDPSPMPAGVVSPEPPHLLPVQCCAFKIILFTYGKAPETHSDCLNKERKDDHSQWIAISRQEAKFIQSEPVTELGREAETPKSQPNAV